MSQEKAQLIAPQGHFTVPGLNVAGVVTASSFSGNCTGTASSIAQGTNVVVGVMTASSFAGDVFGNAAGLSTTTAGLKLGIVTATSFAGNFTGIGSGLTGTPNIVAGLVTATQFIGNTPGLAAGISAGKNLAAGIVTATTFYGDGSNLTGAGSTAFIRQSVSSATTSNSTTNINLNDGNIIYFTHVESPTLSFFNAKTADDITIIRSLETPSFTTGAVTIDGSDDYISIPASSEYDIGTGDFTVECWINADVLTTGGHYRRVWEIGASTSDSIGIDIQPEGVCNLRIDDSVILNTGSGVISTGTWTHIAVCRKSSTMTLYINGTTSYSGGTSSTSNSTDIDQSSNTFYIGANHAQPANSSWDGKISNFRYGTSAVYDGDFTPPLFELSAVAGTKILCCQSDSSATTAADSPGTLTVNGTVTAAAATISQNVSSGTITWPDRVRWDDGTTPTLISNRRGAAFQIFHLLSVDSGLTYNAWEEMKDNPTGGPYTLWTWGYNNYGQLAQNNLTSRSSPTQIPGTTWDQMPLEGSAGSGTSNNWISVKTDGTLWAWGHNEYGELGVNDVNDGYSSPTQIGADTTWSHSAGDDAFHLAIKTDGTLWSWGRNLAGELGLNQLASWPGGSDTRRSSPCQVGTDTSWSKVTTGYRFVMATKTDGTLWTWGTSSDGSLGLNDNVRRSSPCQVGADTDWSEPNAGRDVQGAIKTDGTLYMWGRGHEGATGQNNRTDRSSPIQVPGTTWNTISIGTQPYVLATKTDGTLWAWGNNWKGNLGLNSINPSSGISSPTQVPGTNWSQAGAAEFQSQATKTDGTLWTWGDNVNSGTYGSLGLNDLTQRSSPTQIPGTDWMEASGGAGFGMAFKVSS